MEASADCPSLVSVFDSLAKVWPDRTAVCGSCGVAADLKLTWQQLKEESIALALHIRSIIASGPQVDLAGILAHRSAFWVATTLAVLRCGLPFVWMGAGELPANKRYMEVARNRAIMEKLRPRLVLLGKGVAQEVVPEWGSYEDTIRVDEMTDRRSMAPAAGEVLTFGWRPSSTMCFMLTGGTTGASKCVQVSHTMALHEVRQYPTVATMSAEDRVLQHSGALWAASALGQLDIALAFGATICVAATADQETIGRHGATVLGIVPSSLGALDPEGVPTVQCVFTWGEALSPILGDRWRRRGIQVLELLISTEYWLSFVSSGGRSKEGLSIYSAVPGTEFMVLVAEQNQLRGQAGDFGELCIRGPMVTQGYTSGVQVQAGSEGDEEASFLAAPDNGAPYFRTRDLVTLVELRPGVARPLGIEFAGRSDKLVKVNGQFVNLEAAEQELRQALSELPAAAADAAVIPPPPARRAVPYAAPSAHVFVAVGGADVGAGTTVRLLRQVRGSLPRKGALHLMRAPLPRDAMTGKVDRKVLLSALEGVPPALPVGPLLAERLRTYPQWLLTSLLAPLVDLPLLARLLWCAVLARPRPKVHAGSALVHILLHIFCTPYIWLLSMHAPRNAMRRVTNYVPFGRLGLLVALAHAARGRRWGCSIARVALGAAAVAGLAAAHWKGRLLPWCLAFWLSIADNIGDDCGWWLERKAWIWYADQICDFAQRAPLELGDCILDLPGLLRRLLLRRPPPAASWPAAPARRDGRGAPSGSPPPVLPREGADSDEEAGCPPGFGEEQLRRGLQAMGRERSGHAPAGEQQAAGGHGADRRGPDAARDEAGSPAASPYPDWERIWLECGEQAEEDSRACRCGSAGEGAAATQQGTFSQEHAACPVACTSAAHLDAHREPGVEEKGAESGRAGTGEPSRLDSMTVSDETTPGAGPPVLSQADTSTQGVSTETDIPEESTAALEASQQSTPSSPAASSSWRCRTCGCQLTWGMDWRLEDDAYLCKPCLKDFDNDWWEQHPRDIINVELPDEEVLVEADGGTEAACPSSPAGQRLLELLAPLLDPGGGSGRLPVRGTGLSGVDSQAVLTLCRALRLAMPGLALRPLEVFECDTLGELLDMVEGHAAVLAQSADGAASSSSSAGTQEASARQGVSSAPTTDRRERVIWFAPGQYMGTCKWLYGCRGLLNERSFRAAAERLIKRHEGLHAELLDGHQLGMDLIRFLKETVTLHAAVWPLAERAIAGWPRAAAAINGPLRRAAAWALKGSWPRTSQMEITPGFLDERVRVFRCRSWAEVDEEANRFRDQFTPPLIMALFLLDAPSAAEGANEDAASSLPHGWRGPCSFINFVVSHAFSDGYCSVPLVHDFGSLYAEVEAEVEAARQGAVASARGISSAAGALAALPYGSCFDQLQERFFATIEGRPGCECPDLISLRTTSFDGPAPRPAPWVYNHSVLVELGAVSAIWRSARRYGAPFDVAFLSLVLAAAFRAAAAVGLPLAGGEGGGGRRGGSHSEAGARKMSLPLTLYAPMRDGDLNDAMVGLFSDWRDITVPCTQSTTLLGLLVDIADTIRHRRWKVFDPLQNSEQILVNILPLDEQPRGPQGFRQTRAHEYRGRRRSSQQERRAWKRPHRPMRITLEQEAPDAWWLEMDINAERFPTAWCRDFVRQLRRCITELAERPLVPVLDPAVSRGVRREPQAGAEPPPANESSAGASGVAPRGP